MGFTSIVANQVRLHCFRAVSDELAPILLVDDEKALRKLGKRVLSAAGYRVLEASDGAMALRIAAEEVEAQNVIPRQRGALKRADA